jgi:hypothetical protein
MSVFFQVIDRTSGNVVKDYETEAAALDELGAVVRAHGIDEVQDFALLMFEEGVPTKAAMGDELMALLKASDSQRKGGHAISAGIAR